MWPICRIKTVAQCFDFWEMHPLWDGDSQLALKNGANSDTWAPTKLSVCFWGDSRLSRLSEGVWGLGFNHRIVLTLLEHNMTWRYPIKTPGARLCEGKGGRRAAVSWVIFLRRVFPAAAAAANPPNRDHCFSLWLRAPTCYYNEMGREREPDWQELNEREREGVERVREMEW